VKHSSYDASCGVCKQNAGDVPVDGGVIFENALWLVRHAPPPHPLAGWTMLHTQRHVQGPARFNEREARSFGPTLHHLAAAVEKLAGAARVYVVAFGESFPHMHAHLIPRYSDRPDTAAWGAADLYRAVAAKKAPAADPAKVSSYIAAMKAHLVENPPPA